MICLVALQLFSVPVCVYSGWKLDLTVRVLLSLISLVTSSTEAMTWKLLLQERAMSRCKSSRLLCSKTSGRQWSKPEKTTWYPMKSTEQNELNWQLIQIHICQNSAFPGSCSILNRNPQTVWAVLSGFLCFYLTGNHLRQFTALLLN